MGPVVIDSGWLRRLGPWGLAALLRRRPELSAAPRPQSLQELAERMLDPAAVLIALRRLDLPALQVAEALAGLGGHAVARDCLERLLGVPATATSLDVAQALTSLEEHGLVRCGAGIELVPPARQAFGPPLGLGPPASALLETLTAEDLRVIARNLGLRAPARKADLVSAVLAAVCDADRVRSAVREAAPDIRELLVAIAYGEADGYHYDHFSPRFSKVTSPRHWAIARGLLARPGPWDARLLMPAEVALALRGTAYTAPFDPRPPEVGWTEVEPAAVRDAAVAAAGQVVRLVADLLDEVGRTPLGLLRTGGVGVRDLRRLAKSLNASAGQVRLALTLSAASGLLALNADTGLPTDAYDDWLRLDPGDRGAVLLGAWWLLPRTPSAEPDGAWRCAPPGPNPGGLRRLLLVETADRPGQAPDDPAALAEVIAWRAPCAYPSTDLIPAAAACWQEAALLGAVGANALSPIGQALVAGDAAALGRALETLGRAERCARIQADLTAVVAGTPDARLADLLDGAAHREARGVASVWRFTPASVRRALDAGQGAEALLAELEAVSTDPLPQPLRYLVHDVARRHGAIRVCEVACCLRSEDAALLAELTADRRLRGLGLRVLAPTVLGSSQALAVTLAGLREAGYTPVAESADGTATLERPRPRRTSTRAAGGRRHPGMEAAEADEAAVPGLVATLLARPDAVPIRASSVGTLRTVRAASPHLTIRQAQLLADAIDHDGAVRIDYVNAQGRSSRRVIESPALAGNLVIAWCRLREDERMFNLARIISVGTAAPLLDGSAPHGGADPQLFLAT